MMSFIFYKDKAGKWRWRLTSTANRKIVGASTQGFATRSLAGNNAVLVSKGLAEEGFR